MAEQKTEDTKPPLARRGARPFAGPAGAPSTARPGLRPPSPGQRSAQAPFAPPAVPTRSALGVPTPSPSAAPPRTPAEIDVATHDEDATVSSAAREVAAPERTSVFSEPAAVPEVATPHSSSRPVTSEMVALDAIDAFDALWASAREGASQPGAGDVVNQGTAASPLDESSLGALDAPSMWSEEITAAVEQTASPAEPAEITPSRAPAELDMPAWLADDHEPTPIEAGAETPEPVSRDVVVPEAATPELPTEWPEAPTESVAMPVVAPEEPIATEHAAMADATSPEPTSAEPLEDRSLSVLQPVPVAQTPPSGNDGPRFELVEEGDSVRLPSPEASVSDSRGAHVSAALARLAERVRTGEIDVSSIAPEASDAAMLASVLAALLGGSSSR